MENHRKNNEEDEKKLQNVEKLKRLYKMHDKETGLKDDHKKNDEEDSKKIQRVENLKNKYKIYDKDTSVKGQFSSTPIDTSGVDHMVQEVAISENVRSDLENKMEAPEQQKLIFQQSFYESTGEVNILEKQLLELQAEYKKLQASHRELEEKYDKMCIDTEFKDRDGKTQESIFETKITESRSENDKLLKKISQIEEDLELSQENLQITSVERDSMQKVVEELEGKVTEQEQMKNEKEEIERRLCEVEGDKLELLQKLKAVEKCDVTQQRFIPDLDVTSSLTLKDVSFFVADLQDKITSISNETHTLNEQYQRVAAENLELQRHTSISKEKILNLEHSIAKFNENEETLKKKIEDLQGVTENDSDNLQHAKEEVIMIEKKILELIASLASLEQEKCHVSKELDIKDQDLLLRKKEIEKCKEDYEVKLADLENQLTEMCSVKDQLEAQLEDYSGEVKKKNSETEALHVRIKEMHIEITGLQEENEICVTQVMNLDQKCKMREGKEKTYQTELDSKSAEIGNLKDIILSNESTIKELKESISTWEEQEVNLKKELQEAKHLISEFELKVNEKSEAVGKMEHSYKDLKDIIKELETDKKQLVLDLKIREQEKDILQNKTTGDLDLITELKNEVNEIKRQRNNDKARLENEVDKLKERESSLTEATELAVDEADGLSSKIKTLEMSERCLKQSEENLKKEVQELQYIKATYELKITEFQKHEHEFEVKVRQIGQDKETCETDLRQAAAENETKKYELMKILEDLQFIKEQLNNTSSELESTHEEKMCLAKSIHESDTKNKELEQKVECLKDQLLSVTDDLGHQIKEREAKIAELATFKDLLVSETDVNLQCLQEEKAEIMQKLQQFSDEVESLKRNIEEKEEFLKNSQTTVQTTNEELQKMKTEKDSLVTEISHFKEQLKENDVLIEKKTEIIDQFSTEKCSLTKQLACVEILKNENDQKVSELNKHVNKLTIKVQELSTENDLFKKEKQRQLETETTYITQLKELADKNNRFEEQCTMLQEENETIKSKVEQDGEKLKHLEETLKEKDSKLEQLEKENEKNAHDSEAEVESLSQEISSLQFQLGGSNQLEAEQRQKGTGIDDDQKKRYHAYKTKFERPEESEKHEDLKKQETGTDKNQKKRFNANKTKFDDMKNDLEHKKETETHIQTEKKTMIDEDQKERFHTFKRKFERPQGNKQFGDMRAELELKKESETNIQTEKETVIDEDQKERYHAFRRKFERPQENKQFDDMKDELELKNETETQIQTEKETGIDEDQKERFRAYKTKFERPQENKRFEDMKNGLEVKKETETHIQTQKQTGIDEGQKKRYQAFKAKFERPEENKQFEDTTDGVELKNEIETHIQTKKEQKDTEANYGEEKQHTEDKKATFPSLGDNQSDRRVTGAKQPSRNTTSTSAHGENPYYEWKVSRYRYPIKSDEDKMCNIHGCCQLPSGEIILADNHNQKLKKMQIIDDEYKLVNVINLDSERPWDVCYTVRNEAVAVVGTRRLLFVDILRNMVQDRSVTTTHTCRGVASRGNRLYVIDLKSVHLYATDGTQHSVLYKHQSDNENFRHIAVSDDDSKIYITVQRTGLVTIDSSGNHLYTFTDPALQIAYSLCVDNQGHVWVCDKSRNILQISSDGKRKLGMIKNSSKLIDSYETLCFDMKKSVLISVGNSVHMTALKLE